MKLSRQEQETIILFNEAEQEATVYTHNKALQKRLDGFCATDPRYSLIKTEGKAKTYKVLKKSIRVRKLPMFSETTALKMANKAREVFHQKEKALIQPTI